MFFRAIGRRPDKPRVTMRRRRAPGRGPGGAGRPTAAGFAAGGWRAAAARIRRIRTGLPAVRRLAGGALLSAAVLLLPAAAAGHPMDTQNAAFVQGVDGPAPAPFLYLGAKHMVTGTDHLLFLVGVIFFLYRLRDVVLYVSLFTLGHSITLLAGVLGGLQVNAYLIDAVIGLSVCYKAFENMGGFERVLGYRPNTKGAVLVFGLFHGLGLATKLQEFTVTDAGLVANILSFNAGVEVGQVLALSAVLVAMTLWRTRPSFVRHAFVTNAALMGGGFLLTAQQLFGYVFYP